MLYINKFKQAINEALADLSNFLQALRKEDTPAVNYIPVVEYEQKKTTNKPLHRP